MIKNLVVLLLIVLISSCQPKQETPTDWSGSYTGIFQKGNFADSIRVDIEKRDSLWFGTFNSLGQNAIGIPLQNLQATSDSLNFDLRSDRYHYRFQSRAHSKGVIGTLSVDTLVAPFQLNKTPLDPIEKLGSDVVFLTTDSLELQGTVFLPQGRPKGGIVLVASSGPAGRYATRADAMYLLSQGYATFHYDKRGTGASMGNWQTADMDRLLEDDLSAIDLFVQISRLSMEEIGLMGSSQGAAKIPELLNARPDLGYGIMIGCPGSSLLESDLNFWKNQNQEYLGDDLDTAGRLQGAVFEFLAGAGDRKALENRVEQAQNEPWFERIWIPNLDRWQPDTKMLYSPLPALSQVQQPLLLIKGDNDQVIPEGSLEVLQEVVANGQQAQVTTVIMPQADHGLYFVGATDFPYWRNKHPEYFETLTGWIALH